MADDASLRGDVAQDGSTWQPQIPAPPESIWCLTDESLRQRAKTAWEQSHTLIAAVTDWNGWIGRVAQIDLRTADGATIDRENQLGDQIVRTGRTALRALKALKLKDLAFAPDEPDPNAGTVLESATPLSSWPTAPGDVLDETWYFRPAWPERELIVGTLVQMTFLDDAAKRIVEILETVPEAAFGDSGSPMPMAVNLERRTATYNETPYDVSSVQALRWLKVLADNPGEWIAGSELHKHDSELLNVRTNSLRQFFPDAINALIESKTGAGSRLNFDA